jgi:hypothetical protein
MSIDLMDERFVTDPRRFAPQMLAEVERAATLLAEAQVDLAKQVGGQKAWAATTVTMYSTKYTKWPKWRVDAKVEAEPKFRYWASEVLRAQEAVTIAEAVLFACRERVKLCGVFYSIQEG